jgi:hypothetical protein
MAYSFVLSYARNDAFINSDKTRPDPHFKAFVDRLNRRCLQVTGFAGFVDTSEILPGEDWRDELAESLRTTQALVCLYSPSFFLSEYCGQEMQILLDRRRKYIRENPSGKKPSNIIPVLWQPVPNRIPLTLPDIEYHAPKLNCETDGAWSLGDKGRNNELMDFADEIAIRVRDAADETPLDAWPDRPSLGGVRSAFVPPPLPPPDFDSQGAPQGPATVTFIYTSGKEWKQWPWSPPVDAAALHVSSAAAIGKEMEISQLAFDPADATLFQRLDAAQRRNNIMIMLVDPAALLNDEVRKSMLELDSRRYRNFSTVIVWNKNRKPDLEKLVEQTFPFFAGRTAPHYHAVDNRRMFGDAISKTLARLQLAIINNPYIGEAVEAKTELPVLTPVVARH